MICDFHVHSTASDGSLTPSEVVAEARRHSVECLALTDHDTTTGVGRAWARGVELGVEVMGGVEISVVDEGGQRQMHILGLAIDPDHPPLVATLDAIKQGRHARADRILERLSRVDVEISLERVGEIAGEAAISRPHVAKALVESGICRNPEDAFARYLRRGQPAFVASVGITARRAIEAIHAAGGMASLAHPPFSAGVGDAGGMEAFVGRLVGVGLDGLEVEHPGQGRSLRRRLRRLATQYDLVQTGGSDFHGENTPDVVIGSGKRGNVAVGAETRDAILSRIRTRSQATAHSG